MNIKKYIYHDDFGIIRTIRDPNVLRGHLRMRLLAVINGAYGSHLHAKMGISVMEQDWDTLIILDACRYDSFEKLVEFDGELSKVHSVAHSTGQFLKKNFGGRQFHDTVYVSGNPQVQANLPEDTFHKRIPVWKNEWDEELETVAPDTVTERAKEAARNYPDKRLIVHYMQPHQPFVGEQGREMMLEQGLRGANALTDDKEQLKLYQALRYGLVDISDERLRELFEENLQVTLDSIEKLLESHTGKTVITADHSELLGDTVGVLPMKGYGHPSGLHVEELLTVPWFELPVDSRRDIESDEPEESVKSETESVEERLEALGYT